MNEIKVRIKERFLKNDAKNLDVTNIDLHTDDLLYIGYDRFMQFVTKVSQYEYTRVVTISDIVAAYRIEEKIRTLLNVRIGAFELLLRSVLGEYYLLWYGVHGYKKAEIFDDKQTHEYLMYKVKKQLKMQPEYEVTELHLADDIHDLPIWAAMEISTFQMLTIFYKILPVEKQKKISDSFNIESDIFLSWIEFVLVVRNACAHQGLLFGRTFNRRAILPVKYKKTVYSANYVLNYMLGISFEDKNTTIKQFFVEEEDEWLKRYYGIIE